METSLCHRSVDPVSFYFVFMSSYGPVMYTPGKKGGKGQGGQGHGHAPRMGCLGGEEPGRKQSGVGKAWRPLNYIK